MTTGAPISIIIPNTDADPTKYEPIKDLIRPGHANYTYLQKYGVFDYRGGGRASARETACRVAAGAIANKFLQLSGTKIAAYIRQIGVVDACIEEGDIDLLRELTLQSQVHCPDVLASASMRELIHQARANGDSLGGIVEFRSDFISAGLGDPIYEKLEAKLAGAMMSLPASKGFEMGAGFRSVVMQGSAHNDLFAREKGNIITQTNHAGGTLGGISTGMPVIGRVAFKPPSGIMKPQSTLTTEGDKAVIQLPAGSRHDPCVAIRAVPVVEAMLALVLADSILLNRCARL